MTYNKNVPIRLLLRISLKLFTTFRVHSINYRIYIFTGNEHDMESARNKAETATNNN